MKNLKLLEFQFENKFCLSEKGIQCIEALYIEEKIKIFLKRPRIARENEVAWTFINEREIYIEPTEKVEEFQGRLIHELMHVDINDRKYPNLKCNDGDQLGAVFANLLHHFIVYKMMEEWGFSCEEDVKLVMNNFKKKLREFNKLCQNKKLGEDDGECAYTIMCIMDDLIKLTEQEKNEYEELAKEYIGKYVDKAKYIIDEVINYREAPLTCKWYKECKEKIEQFLKMDKFEWE